MRKNKKSNCRRAAICLLLCLCMTLASLSFTSCDKESGGASDGGLVEVLRVIDDINVGGKITNDRIATVKVSALSVPEGALSDIPKSKYAAVKLYPGDYITEEKLTDVKPATDEDEKPEIDSVDPESLGYIVITSYADHAQGGDYTDAIAKAIEENPGRTIYFPDGNYIIRKPIDIPADPEKSVSLRLSNNTVIKAFDWEDPKTAMIRIGAGSDTQGEISVDEHINTRSSCYVIGGCLNAGAIASGISVEDGRDTLIYNVSIKNAFYGIHIKDGTNNKSSDSDIDDVTIIGNGLSNSYGIIMIGLDNTISNARISNVKTGIQTSGGVFLNNCTVENTTDMENVVGFSGGEAWISNCVAINCDVAFSVGGKRGFYKQCMAIWTKDTGRTSVMFDCGGQLGCALVGCEAEFFDKESSNFYLRASAGGRGRVVSPIFDSTLCEASDATSAYLEAGTNALSPAPAVAN